MWHSDLPFKAMQATFDHAQYYIYFRLSLNARYQLMAKPSGRVYNYNLNPDEMPSNLASHPDPSCLSLRTTFSATMSNIEALRKLKQTRNVAVDNLFGGLRVKMYNQQVKNDWIHQRPELTKSLTSPGGSVVEHPLGRL